MSCDRLEKDIEILEERIHLIDDSTCFSSASSTSFKDQNQNSIKFEDDDKDLFCVGRTLGTQDPYGQRVLQIASILRNLSFTSENAAVLGRSCTFLRFVLLCVRARWSNLHQLGFDTLGNIAGELVLKEAGQRLSGILLQCVANGICSQDRFVIISCLEILNKISQQDSNEETLTLGLNDHVYELICRFLALGDIALLVYTLECLYALTSLGERPCTSIARVRGAIDTLVALVTVEAQSYGPKACILMRVVETVSSVPNAQHQPPQSGQSPQQTSMIQASPTASQQYMHHHHHQSVVNSGGTTHHSNTTLSSNSVSTPPTSVRVASPIQTNHNIVNNAIATSVSSTTATNTSGSGLAANTTTASVNQQKQPQVKVQQQQLKPQQQNNLQQPTQVVQQVSPAPAVVKQTISTNAVANLSSRPATPKNTTTKITVTANSMQQQQNAHQQIIQENEQFALSWLRANFELAPGVKIEQEELYKKYLGSCTKIGRRGVIAPLHFPRCVRYIILIIQIYCCLLLQLLLIFQ